LLDFVATKISINHLAGNNN